MSADIWQQCTQNNPPPYCQLQGTLLRLVESQEQIATTGLVDTLDEQDLLERLLEQSKPPLKAETEKLHYLLSTPFRYPPLKHGSRFGNRFEPSLFYGSSNLQTTLTEAAYYRFVFWQGMNTPPPSKVFKTQHTLFAVNYATKQGLQLHAPPFKLYQTQLTDPADYGATQQLGSAMRNHGIEAFEFSSARDHNSGINVALIRPTALAAKRPTYTEPWLCETRETTVTYLHTRNNTLHHFALEQFLVDDELPRPAI